MVGEELVHLADEPALHLGLVLQAQLLDAGLDDGAGLPLFLGGLVAADVDVLAREQLEHLGQHVLHEGHGLVRGHEDVRADAPAGPGLDRLVGVAAEFGVGGDGGAGVAGHFDFGHDVDVPLGASDDLADVGLRVEAAVRTPVKLLGLVVAVPDEGLVAPGRQFP